MQTDDLLKALQDLDKRAERTPDEYIVSTYVDDAALVGALFASDNGLVFGRRGTGKTHALKYLAESKRTEGDFVVYVDMEQDIGSTEGRYVDPSLSLEERATRLVVDVLSIVHERLLEQAFEGEADFEIQLLDEMLDHFREVVVVHEAEETSSREDSSHSSTTLGATAAPSPSARFGISDGHADRSASTQRVTGAVRHRIHFGGVSRPLRKIMSGHSSNRMWLLLDEWSGIPQELQPFLAEMLRRLFFGIPKVTVRLAAIPHRSKLRIVNEAGDYLGLEMGAEIFPLLDLDEFVVFPARSRQEQAQRSQDFFKKLFFRHINRALETSNDKTLASPDEMMSLLFTQVTSLSEVIRAAEGVPRDALAVLGRAALRAGGEKISVIHVRQAAGQLYQSSKAIQLNGVPYAVELLDRLTADVISTRKARAFLLRRDQATHSLIQRLVDERLLHLIKQGYSSKDEPGVRYDVLQIDYGCYVHLLGTASAPEGLFGANGDDQALEALYGEVVVPEDDYRAIRRAVLDLPQILEAIGHDGS